MRLHGFIGVLIPYKAVVKSIASGCSGKAEQIDRILPKDNFRFAVYSPALTVSPGQMP